MCTDKHKSTADTKKWICAHMFPHVKHVKAHVDFWLLPLAWGCENTVSSWSWSHTSWGHWAAGWWALWRRGLGTADSELGPLVKVRLGVVEEAGGGTRAVSTAVVRGRAVVRTATLGPFHLRKRQQWVQTLFFRIKGHSFLLCLRPSVRLSR